MIYKRNWPSKLGGASIRRGAFIGDNTVIYPVRDEYPIYGFPYILIMHYKSMPITHPNRG